MQLNLVKIVLFGTLFIWSVLPVFGQESSSSLTDDQNTTTTEVDVEDSTKTDLSVDDQAQPQPISEIVDPIAETSEIIEHVEEDKFRAIDATVDIEAEDVLEGPNLTSDRVSFNRKMGVGVSLFSYFSGIQAFYEFRFNPDLLNTIRGQFIYDFLSTSSSGTNLEINRMFFGGSYRIPLIALDNSYVGVGGGYSQMSLNYENTNTGASYSANGGGLYASGEIGWDKYWYWKEGMQVALSVGLNFGLYLAYNGNYDESKISGQTNHRDIVSEGWAAAQQIVQVTVGVGSTF